MKRQNDPSVFTEGTVFVGRINNVEFKVLKVYQKGEAITEFVTADKPAVKFIETETGKVRIRSLDYLCHLYLDVRNEGVANNV